MSFNFDAPKVHWDFHDREVVVSCGCDEYSRSQRRRSRTNEDLVRMLWEDVSRHTLVHFLAAASVIPGGSRELEFRGVKCT